MDINKEREAFEQALVNQKNVSINNLHVCTIFDAEKNKYSPSDVCDPKEDFIVDWINSSWSIWQAAKAQAVPEWISVKDRLPKRDTLVAWVKVHRRNGVLKKWISQVDGICWADCHDGYHRKIEDIDATHWISLSDPLVAQELVND